MGRTDAQPPSFEQSTRNKPRVKTSTHVCTHPRRERRRRRAAERALQATRGTEAS